jgi:hypothetical protein
VRDLAGVAGPQRHGAEVVLPRTAARQHGGAHLGQPLLRVQRAAHAVGQVLRLEAFPPAVGGQQEGVAFHQLDRAHHGVRLDVAGHAERGQQLVLLRVLAHLLGADQARLHHALHDAVVGGDHVGLAVADTVQARVADVRPQRVVAGGVDPQHDDRAVHARLVAVAVLVVQQLVVREPHHLRQVRRRERDRGVAQQRLDAVDRAPRGLGAAAVAAGAVGHHGPVAVRGAAERDHVLVVAARPHLAAAGDAQADHRFAASRLRRSTCCS